MKRVPIIITICMALMGVACQEQYTTYTDKEYVMFAEQEQYRLVEQDQEYFTIEVASTVAAKRDRTFGVEVVDEGSNAIEGLHYRLLSNTITIPAGKLATKVKIKGYYDNLDSADSLGFKLRLVMPEELKMPTYENSDMADVVIYKACPFDINNFTGPCLLTSMLLYNYPGTNRFYQRVIESEQHPTLENTIILHDCFYDGYDVTIRIDSTDPYEPLISMDEDQVISDEGSVFGQILGDNKILGTTSSYYESYYNSCNRYMSLYLHVYVENVGEMVGTVGHFYNVIEWITEEEAEEFRKEIE